ncbi:MAG: glutaredoxin, partial [Nitrospinae bacterium]|nr:glutaredoxin [Nitrospinota bacterium]
MTSVKRQVEVFTAGCPLCEDAVALVKGLACPSCEVVVHDLRADGEAVSRARRFGVNAVPAVVVDG